MLHELPGKKTRLPRKLHQIHGCKIKFRPAAEEDQREKVGRQGVETCEKRRDTKNDEEGLNEQGETEEAEKFDKRDRAP